NNKKISVKKMKHLKYYMIVLVFLLFLTSYNGLDAYRSQINQEISTKQVLIATSFNNTLVIDNNGGSGITWLEARTAGYCTGSGSESDPFIFENHQFMCDFDSYPCLTIRDSSAFFIVRNCDFRHAGTSHHPIDKGIYIYGTQNGQILNNQIQENSVGIQVHHSHDITISGNNVHNNSQEGMMLGIDACNNTVIGNTIINSGYHGILVTIVSDGNVISDNIISDNNQWGLFVFDSTVNLVSHNTIRENTLGGIYISESNNDNVIYGNFISSNLGHGINIEDSNYNSFLGNTIINNEDYGIYCNASNANIIAHNFISGQTEDVYEEGNCLGYNFIYDNTESAPQNTSGTSIPGYDVAVFTGCFLIISGLCFAIFKIRKQKS
ncbi:MAG: right-handed parallel beta-helix repeat-containing protein, partial [Candidatus Lokiarchaeota archaeon]|nr:right-handed parallel beta-helix repeat-containing protein [Candidatus Lokiarchaeota archaeon]